MAARTPKLFDKIDQEFEAAGQDDEQLQEELQSYEFDLESFAASPEAVALLRAQLAAGDITDMDYTVEVPKP